MNTKKDIVQILWQYHRKTQENIEVDFENARKLVNYNTVQREVIEIAT